MKERLFSWRPFRGTKSEKEAARIRGDKTREHHITEKTNPSIALACDWLTTPGGAEKVLLELHHMYPEAPIYTSQYSKKGINWFDDAEVRTGWLQIFPAALRKVLGPLRQLYFSRLDLSEYDLVISVTGAEAKSLKAKTHLCYCHVPTQYYWQMYDKYVENPGFGPLNPLIRLCFKLLVKPLRKADYKSAQAPTEFITISTYAAAQIKKYYNRNATIIAPPVETHKFSPETAEKSAAKPPQIHRKSTGNPQPNPNFSTNPPQLSTKTIKLSTATTAFSTRNRELSTGNPQEIHNQTLTFPQILPSYPQKPSNFPQPTTDTSSAQGTTFPPSSTDPPFVISCRQVTWKRVDLAIKACLEAEKPLLVIGDGPEHKNLVKLANASPLITFIPWLETSQLASYLQTSQAYLFPSLEPFGIAAVEALAAGCPVIAYAEGGSRDFIHSEGPEKNGLLFPEQTAKSLAKALKSFNPADFNPKTVQKSAEKFSPDVFHHKIHDIINKTLKESNHD